MSLLRRIAISNGDPERKEAATNAITEQAHPTVLGWNDSLENEIVRRIIADILASDLASVRRVGRFQGDLSVIRLPRLDDIAPNARQNL